MSDCTNGGRRVYNVPTRSPAEDRLETVLHFVGDTFPRVFVINRLDREVDYVEVDGERYERVRECEIKRSYYYDEYDQYEFEFSCGHSVDMYDKEPPNFCPLCGAKVKVSE